MAERTLTFPAHLFRRVTSPAVISSLAAVSAVLVSVMLRRAWRPQLPRMSDAWMHSRGRDFDRYDHWREY